MMVGSCFSENVGKILQQQKFSTHLNPFGILFNPISVCNNLNFLLKKKIFTQENIVFNNELWQSFYHHSQFSQPNSDICLQNINKSIESGHFFLKEANFLIITLGSAYVYIHKDTGKIVANCHKFSGDLFDKKLLNIDEILKAFNDILPKIYQTNPNLKTIFTVSPVRHWKDGAHENNLSKSTLHLAINEWLKNDERAVYFPAYELVIDDLRDYRFFERDMLHPNQQAIDYVWSHFQETFFDEKTQLFIKKYEPIYQAMQHRPRFPNLVAHQQFLAIMLKKVEDLEYEFKDINFSEEKKVFK